ncbi:hypothetical protein [Aureispira anguillae]|uniref:Uncharacterized protein n=1 Tax=Aureispira anguillae TaxID=2864201 RepID=A0A915YCL8_9BACT|nr:hypothetical protein [Aureispira anguillae]BDS10591.1 hypothetical protein AsAng_0012990 [Aureispira anguillae]
MTKEEKKATLEAKIEELQAELKKMRKLKRAQKIPLVKLSIDLSMSVCQGQLKGYQHWLEQLENPLEKQAK